MCFCGQAWSGQLTLQSGDSISGDLKGIEGDVVLWQSSELGELTLQKNTIKSIKAENPLKIRGKEVPCVWLAMTEDQKIAFRCADGTQPAYPFLSIKHVVPFEEHSKSNFSFTGALRASGWRQEGNTQAEYWELASKVTLRHADIRHVLDVAMNGQRTQSLAEDSTVVVSVNRRSLATYALDWFFVPRWYWSNKLATERDDSRNIQEEHTLGSGFGYQFWERQESALALELGLVHSSTYLEVNPLPNEPEEHTSARLGTSYRFKFANRLTFYHTSELTKGLAQAEPDKANRWKINTDTGMQFPIGFGISADFSVKWDYVNYAKDLNPNASRKDTTYRLGVNYAW